MRDVRKELRDLAETAKQLHLKERQMTLESLTLIDQFERRNAAVNMGMTSERFARFIELTPNQYWKRAQAARVMRFFPETRDMVLAGETQISHLAFLCPRLTRANAKIVLPGIKNKSRREVEALMSRVTSDGRLLDREPEVEVRIRMTTTQMAVLDRAREVLAHGGQVSSLADIVVKALGDLLDKRDPMRKAERAAKRLGQAELPSPGKEGSQVAPGLPSLGKGGQKIPPGLPSPGKEGQKIPPGLPSPGKGSVSNRAAIPAEVKHFVWRRDGGQCTWVHPNGERCPERAMLEIDHLTMWCRGGTHSVENLTLRCRRHNQFAAVQQLGSDFMAKWQDSPRLTGSAPAPQNSQLPSNAAYCASSESSASSSG